MHDWCVLVENWKHWLAQVFTEAAAAQHASFSESPALVLQQARATVEDVMSQMTSAPQEPSLAAAKAAATALSAARRAVAAEALMACLALGLAETTSQVCALRRAHELPSAMLAYRAIFKCSRVNNWCNFCQRPLKTIEKYYHHLAWYSSVVFSTYFDSTVVHNVVCNILNLATIYRCRQHLKVVR